MRILYITDRISARGGADHHLAQVMGDSRARGDLVAVAYGHADEGVSLPQGVQQISVPGLAKAVPSESKLSALADPMAWADVIHLSNVMNPVVIARAVDTRRAVVTVQDHRVFCPAMGKILPDGKRCEQVMGDDVCRACLPDDDYRRKMLALTRERFEAIKGARRIIALSCYMAREMEAAGSPSVLVLPPWFAADQASPVPGSGFLLGGRLVSHKAPEDGWRAWRQSGTEAPLRVAGEGPLQQRLEGTEQLGWLDQATLQDELHRARALLFPARWQEPFGIIGAQALAQGTPVVVARSGGVEEWAIEGCILVPAGDISAMAEAVQRLDRDPEVALALGEAGRSSIAWRFDRTAITAELSTVYILAAQ